MSERNIYKILQESFLVLDGAMGTMIQRFNLTEKDFQGEKFANHTCDLKGNNDILSITRPDIIKSIHNNFNYLVDPHTAVGISGIEKYKKKINTDFNYIAIATAHPAKFIQVMKPIINKEITIPKQLQKSMEKEKNSIIIPAHYSYLKEFLIHN